MHRDASTKELLFFSLALFWSIIINSVDFG
jgi:hypothetical protein